MERVVSWEVLQRAIYFNLSQISFFMAYYGFFTQTGLYKSYIGGNDQGQDHKARPVIFLVAAFGVHTISLVLLLYFSFCSVALRRYRYYHLLKSLGEYFVMLLVSLLFIAIEIGDQRQVGHTPNKVDYSRVPGLATCGLLTVDALFIVKLLDPGHHCALFEVTATLTLHLGLAGTIHLGIPAAAFVLVIVLIKNFHEPRTTHADRIHPTALFAPQVI